MRRISRWMWFWCGLLVCMSTGVQAQSLTYLVGDDAPNCDFNTIQAAINAAQNHPGPDTIRIASNLSYTGLALKVGSQDLTIEGGYATCAEALTSTPPPTTRTTLSGLGAPADSVVEFTGNGVRVLRGLLITRGDDPTSGGGIQFNGLGDMHLENVHVVNNASPNGGGINFHGSGSTRGFLIIGERVVVQGNLASNSGGGVRVTGNAFFSMVSEDSAILDNVAQGLPSDQVGHGGGLLIVGPAFGEVASHGVGGIAIGGNTARYGGGLAVLAPSANAELAIYARGPLLPVSIANNVATTEGGGIYIGGNLGTLGSSNKAHVCALRYRLVNNRAPQGAAIAANEGSMFSATSSFFDSQFCRFFPGDPGVCASGVGCNEISGNVIEDSPQPGQAAILFVREADVNGVGLDQVVITRNVGGSIARGEIGVTDSLIAGNTVTSPLGVLNSGADFATARWENVTIVDNGIGAGHVFESGIPMQLVDSIIEQPGKDIVVLNGGSLDAENLLVNSCGLISCAAFPNVTAVASGPRFIDPANGDYRLQAASAAVDFAPSATLANRDLDGNLRDKDLPVKPNRNGFRDLGAFERQNLEPLVLNGDFVGDFHQWRILTPTRATFLSLGAANNPGGAVLISDANEPSLNELVGMRQCVPLPGPGFYRLTGRASGSGTLQFGRDEVRLRWRYYPETTSNDCTGTVTQGGDVLFPGSATLSAPLEEALIFVDAAEFNERTQVAIELVAIEDNLFTETGGAFDAIRLYPVSAPTDLFSDGFE